MANGCEFDFMEYLDESSIDPNLLCSICHKPFKDPVHTPCDHTYGHACIKHWLSSTVNYSCPLCTKQPVLVKDLKQASRLLTNMLDTIRVRCTLCEETGLQRGNFIDHINKTCPKAIVQCKAADIKCPWKGQRDDLESHMSTCIFEPLRPVLAAVIAENRQLIKQVHDHDLQIKELTKKLSQLSNTAANDSDEESDTESTAGDNAQTDDAIFIQNIPTTVKVNEIFDLFSKIGRIKYNSNTQRSNIFIFNKPNKAGLLAAKVTYVDKESVAAAIAEYNHKHIPQWNTKLFITKFVPDPNRKKAKNGAQGKNANAGAQQNTKGAAGGYERMSSANAQQESPNTDNPKTSKQNKRGPSQHSKQGDKSAT